VKPGAEPAAVRWHPRGLNNRLIVGATYRGVSRLPPSVSYAIGHVGTWIAYHAMRSGTAALIDNFRAIFPDRPERELRALALATYRSYARDVIDFIRSLSMSVEETRRLVGTFETGALDEAMRQGRGAIALSGHFGNWELGGVLLRRLTPYPLAVVVKREPSVGVHRLRQDIRASLAVETLEVRETLEMALRIRERLDANRVVAVLVDRHLGRDVVPVSFFGRPAQFLKTPALLSALTGAPLVPCLVYRESATKFAVECGPAIHVRSEGDRDQAVQEATQAVATVLESHIRRRPHCWYQFYPFWATQSLGSGLYF
jgi:KDO2-lipid IV(A) lauroyltransferase